MPLLKNFSEFLQSILRKYGSLIYKNGDILKDKESRLTETTTIHRNQTPIKAKPQVRWVFEVMTGVDCGRQFMGVTKMIKVGRALENHIQLRDVKVSRFHAVIRQQDSILTIRDLNSTNGTRVNNQVVQNQKQLFSGDLIQLGETVIRVESVSPVDSQP